MNGKMAIPNSNSISAYQKSEKKKKRYGIVLNENTHQSMTETAKLYGLSLSKYIEVLHDTNLLNNNKTEE